MKRYKEIKAKLYHIHKSGILFELTDLIDRVTKLKSVIITARKRSLGQGNVFTGVCLSTGLGGVCLLSVGMCPGVCVQGLLNPGPRGRPPHRPRGRHPFPGHTP